MRILNDIETDDVSGASIWTDSWDRNVFAERLPDWYQAAIDFTADALCSATGNC